VKGVICKFTMPWIKGRTRDLTFNLKPGITVLSGPSGSGKTTLARNLLGLDTPLDGKISTRDAVFWSKDDKVNMDVRQRNFGAAMQEVALFPHLTARDNIYIRKKLTNLEILSLVDDLGITDVMDTKAEDLSGGEARRVAIARALASKPDLLVLDEPTNGLDPKRKHSFLGVMKRVLKNRPIPILYITHDTTEMMDVADRVMVMNDGQIIAQGKLEDVAGKSAATRHLLSNDMGSEIFGTVMRIAGGLVELDVGDNVTLRLQENGENAGQTVRLRILEHDIAIALKPVENISVLNQIPARIDKVEEADGQMRLTLALGSSERSARLRARITEHSYHALKLSPPQTVTALIKAVAIRSIL